MVSDFHYHCTACLKSEESCYLVDWFALCNGLPWHYKPMILACFTNSNFSFEIV